MGILALALLDLLPGGAMSPFAVVLKVSGLSRAVPRLDSIDSVSLMASESVVSPAFFTADDRLGRPRFEPTKG